MEGKNVKVAPVVLVAFLLLATFNIHPLVTRTGVTLSRASYVWAADNSTSNETVVVGERSFTFDRLFYKTTKVILTFPYSNNHTISDISTIGSSVYSYDFSTRGGQSGIFTFIAEDIDIYTFTMRVDYENASARDILISVWQGDLPMENYMMSDVGKEFVIHFRMNLVQQPHYPTDIDVAHEVVYQMQIWLQQILSQQTAQLTTLQTANTTNSVVAMCAAIAAIVAALLAGFGSRKRRMNPE